MYESQYCALFAGSGGNDLSDPDAAYDIDPQGYQESFYPLFSVLCALCDIGGHDVSGDSVSYGQQRFRLGGFSDGISACLYRRKSVPGSTLFLRGGLSGRAFDSLTEQGPFGGMAAGSAAFAVIGVPTGKENRGKHGESV